MLGSRCYNCGGGSGTGTGSETPNVGATTATTRVTTSGTSGSQIAVDVRTSPMTGNQLQIVADGLFVPPPAPGLTSAAVRALFAAPVVADQVLAVDAAGNYGLATPATGGAAETANTGSQTSTLRITVAGASGRQIGGDVRVSVNSSNQIQTLSDGLFVPPPVATVTPAALQSAFATPITITQVFGVDASGNIGSGVVSQTGGAEWANSGAETPSIRITASGALGRQIGGVVKISTVNGNQLQIQSDGLYVAPGASAPTSAGVKALFANGTAALTYGEDTTGTMVKEVASAQLQRLLTGGTFSFATTSSGTEVNGLQVRVQLPGQGAPVNLPGLVIPLEPVRDCNNVLLGYFVKP